MADFCCGCSDCNDINKEEMLAAVLLPTIQETNNHAWIEGREGERRFRLPD